MTSRIVLSCLLAFIWACSITATALVPQFWMRSILPPLAFTCILLPIALGWTKANPTRDRVDSRIE